MKVPPAAVSVAPCGLKKECVTFVFRKAWVFDVARNA